MLCFNRLGLGNRWLSLEWRVLCARVCVCVGWGGGVILEVHALGGMLEGQASETAWPARVRLMYLSWVTRVGDGCQRRPCRRWETCPPPALTPA